MDWIFQIYLMNNTALYQRKTEKINHLKYLEGIKKKSQIDFGITIYFGDFSFTSGVIYLDLISPLM